MDSFLKNINIKFILYNIYFSFLGVFVVGLFLSVPHFVYLSRLINTPYVSPEFIYGADAFAEKKITQSVKPTSMYRGNFKRNGVYNNNLPLNLKILWRSSVPDINGGIHGASKASPAVDSSGVYLGGDDGWFYAFNHDGSLRWKYYTFNNERGIHSTALLSEKYVWFGSYNGRLYALNKRTGELMWSLKLADAIGSSPLIHKGFIYVSVETIFLQGYVLKINAQTGEVIWRSPWLGEQIHSSVTLNPKDKLLYVGANNGIIYGIHMDIGYIFWSHDSGEPIKGTPLFDDNKKTVYFAGWNKKVTALNAQTGQTIWKAAINTASQSSPTEIPSKDILIVSSHRDNGAIYGIKKSTGKVIWTKPLLGDNRGLGVHSGFSAKDQTGRWLYYGACSDQNFCILDPDTGNVLKQLNVGGMLTGAPVPYQSFVYLSLNNGTLVKLGM